MSDSLPLGLSQQEHAKPVDPDLLEQMGKKAAARFKDYGVPLSDCVVDTIKEAGLAPEQVKRVCEFANTAAYLEAFEKAGSTRNVTFDGGPADPGYVLKELNDGSSPMPKRAASYAGSFSAYDKLREFDLLKAAFEIQSAGSEKTASAELSHQSHADPKDELNSLRITLEGAESELQSKLAANTRLLGDVEEDLCSTVRQNVLGGTSLGDISAAWSGAGINPRTVKTATALACKYMKERGHSEEDLQASMSKVAHTGSKPNLQHPLIVKVAAYERVSHEQLVLTNAVDLNKAELGQLNHKIRELVS